jgi:hypothetical protein
MYEYMNKSCRRAHFVHMFESLDPSKTVAL